MFCNLGAESLAVYSAIGQQRIVSRGAALFREGDPGDAVYVVCTGQVKLYCSSKDGKTLILKIAMPGDVLGLGAVISGAAYEVTAESVHMTEVKCIPRAAFLAFLKTFGEGSLNAAKVLSEDYKAAFFDARRLALSGSAAGKLANVLLDWGKNSAACESDGMTFTMALTHEELANFVGSSRETITRTMTRFSKEKLIQMRGSSMIILDPQKLQTFTQ